MLILWTICFSSTMLRRDLCAAQQSGFPRFSALLAHSLFIDECVECTITTLTPSSLIGKHVFGASMLLLFVCPFYVAYTRLIALRLRRQALVTAIFSYLLFWGFLTLGEFLIGHRKTLTSSETWSTLWGAQFFSFFHILCPLGFLALRHIMDRALAQPVL